MGLWPKPTWSEKYIAAWITLLESVVTILSFAFFIPEWSLDYRCMMLRKRMNKSRFLKDNNVQ